jgi:hypothetical protein
MRETLKGTEKEWDRNIERDRGRERNKGKREREREGDGCRRHLKTSFVDG